jgi:ribose transport system substrate-binding protein
MIDQTTARIGSISVNRATRRQVLTVGAWGSVVVLATGAGAAFAADKPKVGLVMKSLANEFFKQMQAGAEDYARKPAPKTMRGRTRTSSPSRRSA